MISFLREFWAFLRVRKKYWLLPIFVVMAMFGGLIVLTKGSAVAPSSTRSSEASRVRVLGISAFYHDSAAALVENGRIVAAAQEERFTRKKFDAGYPRRAIDYCLEAGRYRARGHRPRRLLRQAISQVRAAARDLSHL